MKALVITRDRLTYTQRCVAGLLATPGITDVYLIDHGSTYPTMTHWLGEVGGKTFRSTLESALGLAEAVRVHVHWRGNAHPRDVFANGTVDSIVAPGERFVLTDCDVEPPADPGWLDHLGALLDLNPRVVKAGCGLHTDDLPDSFEHADRVRLWEAQYQGFAKLRRDRTSGLAWYDASVDTTLALYRGPGRFALDPSVRSADARFMARHLPWYEDSSAPQQEDVAWYVAHALPGVSMWADPDRYEGTYGLEGSTR